MRKLTNIVAALVATLSLSAVAYASTTPSSPNSFGGGGNPPVLKPNCSREQMFLTPAGKTWAGAQPNGKTFVFGVGNVLDNQIKCLIHRVSKVQKPKPAQLLYKSVYATGTGQTVSAQCPAGYYVSGGGSHFEVEGSYPTGNDAWVVVRDHASPRVLDVTAICIRVAS